MQHTTKSHSGGGIAAFLWPWKGQNGALHQTSEGGADSITSFVNNTAYLQGGGGFFILSRQRYPMLQEEIDAGNTSESMMSCKFATKTHQHSLLSGDLNLRTLELADGCYSCPKRGYTSAVSISGHRSTLDVEGNAASVGGGKLFCSSLLLFPSIRKKTKNPQPHLSVYSTLLLFYSQDSH